MFLLLCMLIYTLTDEQQVTHAVVSCTMVYVNEDRKIIKYSFYVNKQISDKTFLWKINGIYKVMNIIKTKEYGKIN